MAKITVLNTQITVVTINERDNISLPRLSTTAASTPRASSTATIGCFARFSLSSDKYPEEVQSGLQIN